MHKTILAVFVIATVSCATETPNEELGIDIDGAADVWDDDTLICTDIMNGVSSWAFESCMHQDEETCVPALDATLLERGLECCEDDTSQICAMLDRAFDVDTCPDVMQHITNYSFESCMHQDAGNCYPALDVALIGQGLGCCGDDPSEICVSLDRAFDVDTCTDVLQTASNWMFETCMHQDEETCVPALDVELIGKGLGCCGDDPSSVCSTLDRAFDVGTCPAVMESVSNAISEVCVGLDEGECRPVIDGTLIAQGLACCGDDPSAICVSLDTASASE